MDLRDVLGRAVVLAPMAGGPTTPELVLAGADAGALGFLAAAYRTADQVRAEMASLGRVPYGVNVFVPGHPAEPPTAYVERLRSEGFDVAEPTWDDDHWDDKIELLLAEPPPVITFTFGCPDHDVVEALQERSAVGITVTVPEEAALAVAVGASFLCVQGHEAGAHRGTFTNAAVPDARPLPQLLADIRAGTDLPLLAAGGVGTAEDVRALLTAGAIGVQCGTAFLRCPEAGTRQVWKDALAEPRYTETVVTRAFSGRPARGLRNRFIDDHPDAPAAYPEINKATRPLRAAGDPEAMSLWAGTGWRSAEARPVAEVLDRLSS
ncbi:MAG: 2-nitropropane dioxygenase [Acidimicrobiales bacterium]|nr:2-nitropropane dioxygenase [Acidimicrobiales bacterium]